MAQGLFTLKQQLLGVIQKAWNTSVNQLKTPAVDYLVVAGGGGGGRNWGGGGGGGGLLQGSVPVASGTSYTVTVGSGGTGDTSDTNPKGGTNGVSSVFGSISALGGGLGGSYNFANGGTGGSGGGQGSGSNPGTLGQGTSGQGNAGGASDGGSTNSCAGGGGGAGTVGLNALTNSTRAGNGGAGIASAISGTVTTYAGGGGGTSNSAATAGTGGVGGGGNGGLYGTSNPVAGTANTGGGGGGGQYSVSGGNGGSGIVIVSYPDIYAAATSTTGSPTVGTSGAGSISFNGSSTTLYNTTGYAANQFGTGNFTIEFWQYYTAFSTFQTILSQGYQSSTGTGFLIQTTSASAGTLAFYSMSSGSATALITESGTVNLNTWYHVAIVKNGSTTTMYRNGVSVGSATDANNYANTGTFVIGSGSNLVLTAYYYAGYLSNLRVVKGTAVYTGNFTPPTSPLTAVTNTSVLLNSVSGAYLADSSTSALTLAVAGTPTWNQSSPFATGLGYKNRVYTWTSSGSITF